MNLAKVGRLLVVSSLAFCRAPAALLDTASAAQSPVTRALTLPRKDGSVRFAVMGDTVHGDFPFAFVIMLGDNIIGADTPAEMANKFSTPYKPLLDADPRSRPGRSWSLSSSSTA